MALDPRRPDRVIDVRYSLVPNRIAPLWGIQLDRGAPGAAHVAFFTARRASAEDRAELQRMLFGPIDVPQAAISE